MSILKRTGSLVLTAGVLLLLAACGKGETAAVSRSTRGSTTNPTQAETSATASYTQTDAETTVQTTTQTTGGAKSTNTRRTNPVTKATTRTSATAPTKPLTKAPTSVPTRLTTGTSATGGTAKTTAADLEYQPLDKSQLLRIRGEAEDKSETCMALSKKSAMIHLVDIDGQQASLMVYGEIFCNVNEGQEAYYETAALYQGDTMAAYMENYWSQDTLYSTDGDSVRQEPMTYEQLMQSFESTAIPTDPCITECYQWQDVYYAAVVSDQQVVKALQEVSSLPIRPGNGMVYFSLDKNGRIARSGMQFEAQINVADEGAPDDWRPGYFMDEAEFDYSTPVIEPPEWLVQQA